MLAVVNTLSFAVFAEGNTEEQKYHFNKVVNTGIDNGYSEEYPIKNDDPHYGWNIGSFCISGFTAKKEDSDKPPVFLKNVGDKVKLSFLLEQDIDMLNGNESVRIAEDENGYDQYFETQKANYGRGTLIVRKTDYTNKKGEPVIYSNYLMANAVKDAENTVELCEEGDYEVALDYEIVVDGKILGIPAPQKYYSYRMFFVFSVRNGNCMVFPFDSKTKKELKNTAITENGFYLDLAKSRYLDINIRKEVLTEGADGLTEDTRFNKPAKDGEQYTDEGIYTITVKNKYTDESTIKKIYVGTNKVLKAYVQTGMSIKDINDQLSHGATIDDNGFITVAENTETSVEIPQEYSIITEDESPEYSEEMAEEPEENGESAISMVAMVFIIIVLIAVFAVVVMLVVFIIVMIKTGKKKKIISYDKGDQGGKAQ